MKKLTSSIYSFERLRQENYFYVDKTEYLWKLIQNVGESYFLTRPRRFGKSLTVSTLKAIFEGKRKLFEGLAIDSKEYDWKIYPVIHLSFGDLTASANTAMGVKKYLLEKVLGIASRFSVSVTSDEPGTCLGQIIDKLNEKSDVVILVDEYDKPLIDNINSPDAEEICNELKCFYGVLKDRNDALRMLFITGVTKFCHVSLFSGFNNPTDISMHNEFATMLGYTQSELEKEFAEYIDIACQKNGMEREKLLDEIKKWYDGFRFEETAESVYNPVSLAKFFENNCKFNNYWFATGTPTFLMKLAREKDFNIEKTISEPVPGLAFNAFEIDKIDPLTLLLQTGYLTIKSSFVDEGETLYYLDFPNKEVKNAFETYLINDYTGLTETEIGVTVFKLRKALRSENFELFMDLLKTFYAGIDYDMGSKVEARYQIIFVTIFNLLGFKVVAESHTNIGRIDTCLENENNVYIFEFKINQSAEIALSQIKEKEYYQKFKHSGKEITLIGINFNTETRQIATWEIDKG